ncbi:hypothetical protein CONPUDRAFT_168477 [Coniophora puteana RWD-64-598 SS2]|uniref:DUF1365-domain-containing protein n=1 Tax=Coniophora puteana (strain RWD-64-598) TaxID=741705 RepID=A0A5M3MCM5_CONPW|nr:uncharacterized protein CONPUDRAFT_168477 [Coniophora puteana RWD-64-598 SS2]EIW76654.1 hypothetical protein CONPUDRAFT_168477 [Coniophora puteana RWD-64-598 SS2]
MPRIVGFEGINPLTVYYCYDVDATFWLTVLEVHNTFGESHVYLLQPGVEEDIHRAGWDHQWTLRRAFFVSPFNNRTGSYVISVKTPSSPPFPHSSSLKAEPPRPSVSVHYHPDTNDQQDDTSNSTLSPLKLSALLRPTSALPLTPSNLLQALFVIPLDPTRNSRLSMPLGVALFLTMPRILGEALVLHYRKQLPIFARPEPVAAIRLCPAGADTAAKADGVCPIHVPGTTKAQPPSLLQDLARKRVYALLSHRLAEATRPTVVELLGPAIGERAVFASPSSEPSQIEGSVSVIRISVLAHGFYSLLFMAPSARAALLAGGRILSKSEDGDTTWKGDMQHHAETQDAQFALQESAVPGFLSLFSDDTLHLRTPDSHPTMMQRIRQRASGLPLPLPARHPLDKPEAGSSFSTMSSVFLLCILLALDELERIAYALAHVQFILNGEPWGRARWSRARAKLANEEKEN